MKTIDRILANVVLAALLTSCYFLLPTTLIAACVLQGFVSSYTYLVGLLRSAYHGMVSKCLRLVIVPVLLIAMTAIYWIKSRHIDIANLLSPRRVFVRLKATQESTIDFDLLAINQAFPIRVLVHIDRAWSWIKHCADPKAAQEPDVNIQVQRGVEGPAAEGPIFHEEAPVQEPEVVQEPPVAELNIIEVPARARTREEQRLHRYIEDLEALEAEGLPETMTTEEAILLVMTRTAAANGKGVVCYSLSEKQGPYGRDHRPEIHQHQLLRPHDLYYKLHTSRGNVFRPDEPDCAICYSPLVNGEAMITHDTCRRTFHEVCYTESLRRRKSCPFDREGFVTRTASHADPTPVADPVPNAGTAEQPIVNLPAPAPLQVAWATVVQRPRTQAQPQAQPQIQTQAQPQAQPPRPVRIYRGQPPRVVGTRLPARRPADEHNRPQLAGPQVQRPGNDRTQNHLPRNDGRPPNTRIQPSDQRARNGARRAWR